MRGGRGARQAFLGSRRRIRGLNPTSLPKEEESQTVNRSTSDRAGAVAGESKAQANDSGGCLVHYAAAPWRASPRGLQGQYGCPERAGLQHTSVARSAMQTTLTRPLITHAAAMAGGPQWTVLFVFRTPRRGRLFHGGSCRHAAGTRTCGLGLAIGVFPLIFAAERPLVSCRAIPRPLSTRRVRASAPPPAPSSIAPPPPLLLRECLQLPVRTCTAIPFNLRPRHSLLAATSTASGYCADPSSTLAGRPPPFTSHSCINHVLPTLFGPRWACDFTSSPGSCPDLDLLQPS